jgi:acyl-CoA synthetase (AMP-forming)/AMP-acid ligase II
MIISGGFNVYSREVERALEAHPAVREAAVVGVPDREWGESIVAFVVLHSSTEIRVDDLVRHCQERIASYKKPRAVHVVSELPRNVQGKVRKPELREEAIRFGRK